MKKFIEIPKAEIRNYLEEQRKVDMHLFDLLFPIFNSMSRIGQVTTLDTLSMYLDLEKEV